MVSIAPTDVQIKLLPVRFISHGIEVRYNKSRKFYKDIKQVFLKYSFFAGGKKYSKNGN